MNVLSFCVFKGVAKKMWRLALRFEPVMLSPCFTAGNDCLGKNNNTEIFLNQRGCLLVATVRKTDQWFMVSKKTESCNVVVCMRRKFAKKREKNLFFKLLYIVYTVTGSN